MLFDFGRFTSLAKLAYRRCEDSAYSFEDVLRVFEYYFNTYELIEEKAHPMISVKQIAAIIDKMPHGEGEHHGNIADFDPEAYEKMIDQHFATQYRCCDYNINHFFSGKIRDLRFYETCY